MFWSNTENLQYYWSKLSKSNSVLSLKISASSPLTMGHYGSSISSFASGVWIPDLNPCLTVTERDDYTV